MALNFMGLGFTFEAEDEGLSDYMERLSESLVTVAERLRGVGEGAPGIRDVAVATSASAQSMDQAGAAIRRTNEAVEEGGSLWSRLVGYLNTKSLMRGAAELSRTVDALGQGLKSPFDQAVKWEQAQRDLNARVGMGTMEFEKYRQGVGALVARTGQSAAAMLELGTELQKAGMDLTEFGTGASNVTQLGADLASAFKFSTGQVAEFITTSRGLGVTGEGLQGVLDAGSRLEKEFKVTGLIQEIPGLLNQVRENAMKLGKGFGSTGQQVVKFSLSVAAAIRKQLNVSMQEAAKAAGEALGGFTTLQDQFDRMKAGMGDWTEQMDQAVEGLVMAGFSGDQAVDVLSTIGTSVDSQRTLFEQLSKAYQQAGGETSAMGMRMRLMAQDLLGTGAAAALTQGKTDEFLKSLDAGMQASTDSAGAFDAAVTESYKGLEQQRGVSQATMEFNQVLAMSQTSIQSMAAGLNEVNRVMATGMQTQLAMQQAMAQTTIITQQMAQVPVGSERYEELRKQLEGVQEQYGAAMTASSAFTFTAADGVSRVGALADTGPGASFLGWLEGIVKESPLAATSIFGLTSVIGALGLRALFFAGKVKDVVTGLRSTGSAAEGAAASGSLLSRIWRGITGIFGKVGGFFGRIGEVVRGFGAAISRLTGGVRTLFQATGKLAGVGKFFGFLGKLAAPIGVVIGAVDSLYKNWENLTSAFSNFSKAWDSDWVAAILSVLKPIGDTLWDFVDSFTFGLFGALFTPLVDFLDNGIASIRGFFGATDKEAADAMEYFSTLWGGLYDVIVAPIGDALGWVGSKLGEFGAWSLDVFSQAGSAAKSFGNMVIGFFKSVGGWFTDNPIGNWIAEFGPVKSIMGGVVKTVDLTTEAFSALWGGIKGIVNTIFVGDSPSLVDAFTQPFAMLTSALNLVAGPISLLWEGIKSLASGVVDLFSSIWTGITEKFTGLPEWISGVWGTILTGVTAAKDLLVGGFTTWLDSIKAVFSGIADWIKNALGLGEGGALSTLMDQATSVKEAVTGVISDPIGAATSAGTGLMDAAASNLSAAADTVKSGLSGAYDSTIGAGLSLLGFAEGGIVERPTIGMIAELSQPEAVVPLTPEGISSFVAPVMARAEVDFASLGMFKDFSPAEPTAPQVVTVGPDGSVTTTADPGAVAALQQIVNNVGMLPGQLMDMLLGPEEAPAVAPAAAGTGGGKLTVNVRGTLRADMPSLSRHLYAVIDDEAGAAGMGIMGNG